MKNIWVRTKDTKYVGFRVYKPAIQKFEKLCKELGWDISKRLRYLIEKDIKNLEKQIQLKQEG